MKVDPALLDRNHGSDPASSIDVVLPRIEPNMTIRQADDHQHNQGTSAGRKFNVDDIYQKLVQHIDAKLAADPQKKEYDHNPVSALMETINLTVLSTSMRAGPLAQRMRLISATKGQRVMISFVEKTAMLTTEAFIEQNQSVRDMIDKALRHCMMRSPGHRVVHSSDPYLDPKMLFGHSVVRRGFAPTLFSSGSSETLPSETWNNLLTGYLTHRSFCCNRPFSRKLTWIMKDMWLWTSWLLDSG